MFELIPFERRGNRVSAYDPFRMLDEMERSFFGGNNHPAMSTFRTDVTDTGDAFVLDAELPGVPEDAISLTVEDGVMTVSADYRSESRDEKTCYSERRTGHVQRSFSLENIDEEHISAEYKDGILRVTMPKAKPEDNSGKRLIPINGRLTGGTEAPAEKNGDA